MAHLLTELRSMLAGDELLLDDELQSILDRYAVAVHTRLDHTPPRYTRHPAPIAPLEDGALIYAGVNTELVEGEDYTIDLLRGVVTTPEADYRALFLQGTAYDLNAAAAEGWNRIAARYAAEFDFSANNASHQRSQRFEHAAKMEADYRSRAWARTATVDRADQQGGTRADDLLDGWRRDLS